MLQPKRFVTLSLLSVFSLMLGACGADEPSSSWTVEEGDGSQTQYDDGTDVIITPESARDDEFVISGGASGGCVELDTGECVDVSDAKGRYCGGEEAKADIILGEDGEVVEVVCYPDPSGGTAVEEAIIETESGAAQLPQNTSGVVVVFDEETNGEPIVGDVRIDGERTTLFGNGPGNTILDGELAIASNNSRIRGLTVIGDVVFEKNSNNSKLAFCEILGSLTASNNGFTAVNTLVFGDVSIDGNDVSLINIGVQGEWSVTGSGQCQGCYSFSDEDADGVVTDEEVGDALECNIEG